MRGNRLLMRDAEFIRLYAELGFTVTQLAREYDVHPDTIRNVVKGLSFRPEGHRSRGQEKRRKLTDEQVRQIRQWTAEGLREQAIAVRLGNVVRRGTVRQVMAGNTYRDVK